MVILLATLSAVTFGTGDFFGGIASKRISAVLTTFVAQFVGLVLILGACLLVSGSPTVGDLWMGSLAGLAGCIGITCFYWAMSIGPMGVIAPITALLNALVPVSVGLVLGERPEWLAAGGIVLAIPAILMISREPTRAESNTSAAEGSAAIHRRTPGWLARIGGYPVLAGAFSGVCFGFFFVLIGKTSARSGLWPIVSARGTAIVVIVAVMLVAGIPESNRSGVRLAAVGGCLDVAGNTLYMLASHQGMIVLVGMVGALYPASTILLARIVLRERLARHQMVGLGVAAGAVALIAAAS